MRYGFPATISRFILLTAAAVGTAACGDIVQPEVREDLEQPRESISRATEAGSQQLVYVANHFSHSVSVIETTGNTVLKTIPVAGNPFAITILPNGSYVYVAATETNAVAVIETASNTVVATVPVGGVPFGLAASPDGALVYVVLGYPTRSLSVIETAGNTVVTTFYLGNGTDPYGIDLSPDGALAYVASSANSKLSVVDLGSRTVVAEVPLSLGPLDVAITPDGDYAYVPAQSTDDVAVIETTGNTVLRTISVGDRPVALAITPDGSSAYVANGSTNTISVIDLPSSTVAATVTVGSGPSDVAITRDGTFAYVANLWSRSVSVIHTSSNTVVATVSVGVWPRGIAVLEALTPQDRIAQLIDDVEDLVDQGLLAPDPVNGLIAKLEAALFKLDQGKARPAVNKLDDFIDQVSGLIRAGKLNAADGQALIDDAQAIIDGLVA